LTQLFHAFVVFAKKFQRGLWNRLVVFPYFAKNAFKVQNVRNADQKQEDFMLDQIFLCKDLWIIIGKHMIGTNHPQAYYVRNAQR